MKLLKIARDAIEIYKSRPQALADSPDVKVKPILVDGELVDIEIHGMEGFNSEEEKRFFIDSMVYLTKCLASTTFKERFLALKVTETNGKKLSRIYQEIITGFTLYFNKADGDLDLIIKLYTGGASGTIGYTYVGTLKIFTSRAFFLTWFRRLDHASLAGHIFHELMHSNLGYKHAFSHRGTVVYESGYLVTTLIQEMKKGKSLTPAIFLSEEVAQSYYSNRPLVSLA